MGRSSVAFTETISLVAQPAGESQLRSMCDKLWALHNDMHPASCKAEQATALNLSWSDVNSGPSGAAGAARLLHEYQAFLVALSAAMMEGLRLLALLATAQEGPSANGPGPSIAFRYNAFHYLVFDVSWKVVCKSTLVKGMWPMDWPLHSAPPDHLYHTALDSLVSWLLLFNRGKSALWKEAQRQENADKAFRERLYYMLQPPVLHMQNISLLEGKERELAVAALPPAFVAKLCCVLCEGLRYRKGRSNAPLDLNGLHTVAHMVALMAMAVGRLVCSEHPTKAGAQTRALFSPAVIELARLALVACSKTDMQALSGVDAMRMSMYVGTTQSMLLTNLGSDARQEHTLHCRSLADTIPAHCRVGTKGSSRSSGTVARSISASSGSSSSSSDGSKAAELAAADLIPKVLTSDEELFRALRSCSRPWTSESCDGLHVMITSILESDTPGSLMTVGERVACLVTVLRHVSQHTCAWMQMQRRAAGRRAPVTLLHLQSMTQMQMLMVTGLKSFRALGRGEGFEPQQGVFYCSFYSQASIVGAACAWFQKRIEAPQNVRATLELAVAMQQSELWVHQHDTTVSLVLLSDTARTVNSGPDTVKCELAFAKV